MSRLALLTAALFVMGCGTGQQAQPTTAMLAEARAMLDGLELPDWGPWETP